MCPPGVDQTCRSSQRWQLLVPKLHQIHPFDSLNALEIDSPENLLFNPQHRWGAWEKLAKPVATTCHSIDPAAELANRNTELSLLESQPAEILAIVVENLSDSKSDSIALGLASSTLWRHILRRISQDHRSKDTAAWAGAELACTGTWLTCLPENFIEDNSAVKSVHEPGRMPFGRRFNWDAVASYHRSAQSSAESWREAFAKCIDLLPENMAAVAVIPTDKVELLKKQLNGATSFGNSVKDSMHWILRDLKTKEYVCLVRPQASSPECHIDHPDASTWLRLDDALLMQVLWSPDSHRNRSDYQPGPELYRGAWAGHAFDIVARSRSVEEGWKDVTKEIVQKAAALCDSLDNRIIRSAGRKASEESATVSKSLARLEKSKEGNGRIKRVHTWSQRVK
jgi:hypothetical protein